jgi:hypothetical protein
MANKKYIFIAAFFVSIFISVTTRCGTTFKHSKCCIQKKQTDNDLYYENHNLVFIKYFY